ncbi:hypothetical protein Pmar_PMAR022285 [Perkinsus marinus ATCC 50983]|uniref:Uncharacterized protein n=1 Tax=Perkinsus marinus (strain ATCC 50983 / TXsc) TaxID=423536 RepID=C5KDP1_PERM5|nr:hypothetical protein Pmar_PMAR022285 [Perkinsus marinus ATCC 50983]EER17344.1 hypothetical protein Pmar_PMAR022285 [Perkinsus marinus ATCC 50983]|eukprot:XP_002785548.1 hypothetical protein Pmar_PMAR022285 [Perkinsus marinus ATCC 50983]
MIAQCCDQQRDALSTTHSSILVPAFNGCGTAFGVVPLRKCKLFRLRGSCRVIAKNRAVRDDVLFSVINSTIV